MANTDNKFWTLVAMSEGITTYEHRYPHGMVILTRVPGASAVSMVWVPYPPNTAQKEPTSTLETGDWLVELPVP